MKECPPSGVRHLGYSTVDVPPVTRSPGPASFGKTLVKLTGKMMRVWSVAIGTNFVAANSETTAKEGSTNGSNGFPTTWQVKQGKSYCNTTT